MILPARRLIVLAATGLLVGCGAHVRPVTAPPTHPLPIQPFTGLVATPVTLALDPTTGLILGAEREFSAGEAELTLGHRVAARERFDAAVDLLLSAPGGARAEARLQAEFDTLLDRIGAHETLELRAGDGFSEARSEPAVIDDLLAVGTFDRSAAPARSTEELVRADLAKTPHDVPIPINSKVLSYVELFQGNLRSFMEDGLERGSRYLPMIFDVFTSEGVPLDLAYVPLVESAFKPTALSRASAKGLWQFEAGTAKDEGLRQNWFLDERSDPEKATRAAAQYLKMLRDLFDGDWNLALASYNAGMGRVQRAMKLSKRTDYWDLTSSTRYLPRETREYVPMIMAAIIIGRNPQEYGFEIGPVEPLAYETVTVPDALNLGVVAEWLNLPITQIQGLNPELRRGMTPMGQHDLKVPVGTASTVEANLATAPPSVFAKATFNFYTVKKGETLAAIARKYKITTSKLASANDLKTNSRLKNGATLMVPMAPAPALASRASSQRSVAQANTTPPDHAIYKVKPGDTLYGIARQFDVTVENLKELNRLSSDAIGVGDKLTVRR